MSSLVNSTQRVSENCENSREVAERSANALNFYCISQLGCEFNQKKGIVKKKKDNRAQMGVTYTRPHITKLRLIPTFITV